MAGFILEGRKTEEDRENESTPRRHEGRVRMVVSGFDGEGRKVPGAMALLGTWSCNNVMHLL